MFKKDVIVLSADSNYINHAKYLISSLHFIGNWKGDYCLISNGIEQQKLKDFIDRGIYIFYKNKMNPFFTKLTPFSSYFKQWRRVCFMDCDFLVFKDINDLISNSTEDFLWDAEAFKVEQYLTDDGSESYKALKKDYDLSVFGYNTSCIIFDSCILESEDGTVKKLEAMRERIKPFNSHTGISEGTDQPVLNLFFYDKLNQEHAYKNRVIFYHSAITSNTIAAHTCRWDAPWVSPCYRPTYDYNLSQFEKIKKV